MIATAPRATTPTWTELNQRYLSVALAELRQRSAATTDQPPAHPSAELAELAEQMSAPPAIEALRQTFGLSPFERDLVLLCTGVELDGGPAPPTPENITAVMEFYPVGERFLQEFTLRQVLLNAAKNGCMDASRSASAFLDRPA